MASSVPAPGDDRLCFVSLEITRRCQLGCQHCYASSGPTGWHGTMTTAEWMTTIEDAATAGVRSIQFIGGEPTLHPDLPLLVEHALDHDLEVEIFSNLVRVQPELWALFERPGLRLATSYYSPEGAEHDAITGRRSHDRTLGNIRGAHHRGIPLRVGIIEVIPGQNVAGAGAEMTAMGVTDIRVDRLREIGRGAHTHRAGADQLCGRCADGRLAILPTGEVTPCVLARWLVVGSVRTAKLPEIYAASALNRAELRVSFVSPAGRCSPDDGGCVAPLCSPHWDPR